jgi:hypothetical protein
MRPPHRRPSTTHEGRAAPGGTVTVRRPARLVVVEFVLGAVGAGARRGRRRGRAAVIVCADPRTLDRVLATGAPARRTALGQHIVARRAA